MKTDLAFILLGVMASFLALWVFPRPTTLTMMVTSIVVGVVSLGLTHIIFFQRKSQGPRRLPRLPLPDDDQ